MFIKRVAATNFKSYDNINVKLSNFSALIGSNASGKSNFVEIFEFMNDIFTFGIENAVSMHGGREYLPNSNIGFDEPLSVSFEVDSSKDNINFVFSKNEIIN